MSKRWSRGHMSPKKVVVALLATFFLAGPVVESVLGRVMSGAQAGAVGPVAALAVIVALVVLIVKRAMGAPAPVPVTAPALSGRAASRRLGRSRDDRASYSFGYSQPASIGDGIRDFPIDGGD